MSFGVNVGDGGRDEVRNLQILRDGVERNGIFERNSSILDGRGVVL